MDGRRGQQGADTPDWGLESGQASGGDGGERGIQAPGWDGKVRNPEKTAD